MWLSCPVTGRTTQSASDGPAREKHYTHIPALLGRRVSAKPNLINKCSSPVPQLSEMKMILCGSEQSDGDSTGRNREGQKAREKETE